MPSTHILSQLPSLLYNPRRSIPAKDFDKQAASRLSVFVREGLIPRVPTFWQLLQGQMEMAPYVLLPDEGDDERYENAPLGHPLMRSPLVLYEIGWDHFRIGHGLHAKPESVYRHLNFVFHQDIPVFDLQLVQSLENGLDEFRQYTQEIQDGATAHRRSQRARVDLILPEATQYRHEFLKEGGWIDQMARFEYPTEVSDFLRPEFTSLIRFANYCAESFDEQPFSPDTGWVDRVQTMLQIPPRLIGLATRRLRD